jgi:hypothetical protein
MPSPDTSTVLTGAAPILIAGQLPELSVAERAAFQHAVGMIDRSLARLRIGERRRVWGHLARLCGDLAAD